MSTPLAVYVAGRGLAPGRIQAPGAGGTTVSNSSVLSFDLVDLTDVAGFLVRVDGGTDVDVGIPTAIAVSTEPQVPLGGGGITFSIPVTALGLANGDHSLEIYSYNYADTLSSNPASLSVTKI